jgi:hypothetical protein
MANPNRTVARIMQGAPRDPRVVASINARMAAEPMVQDMAKFQSGEMSADEFRAKWDPSFKK